MENLPRVDVLAWRRKVSSKLKRWWRRGLTSLRPRLRWTGARRYNFCAAPASVQFGDAARINTARSHICNFSSTFSSRLPRCRCCCSCYRCMPRLGGRLHPCISFFLKARCVKDADTQSHDIINDAERPGTGASILNNIIAVPGLYSKVSGRISLFVLRGAATEPSSERLMSARLRPEHRGTGASARTDGGRRSALARTVTTEIGY